MPYSLQGLNSYISSEISAEYWLNHIYPPEIRDAHNRGDIHIHDLAQLSGYCVGWDLMELLKQGFRGVEGKVESAPPKHLWSALGQVTNFFIHYRVKLRAPRLFPILTHFSPHSSAMTIWAIISSNRPFKDLYST